MHDAMVGRKSYRERKALSPAVAAIILVVAAIAISLIVFAMTSGLIGGFGTTAKVVIEKVDVIVNPSTGAAIAIVDVRNGGGVRLQACTVTLTGPGGVDVNLNGPNVLTPGASASYRADIDAAAGIQAGQYYTAIVECQDPSNREVRDTKQVIAHI